MSNSHRGPSIDASFQVSFYLAKLCQSRRFLEIDQSEKKCLWRSSLLTDWDKMSNLYKRTFHRCFLPSFGSFGLALSSEKIFQKQTNQKQESTMVAMFVNGLEQNEQSLQRTFHRCFLPSFGSFGHVVSEERIFRSRPIRKKNCLWRQCLPMDWNEMSTLHRGPPIDASSHVSDQLANRFQRRIIFKISLSETSVACGGHVR